MDESIPAVAELSSATTIEQLPAALGFNETPELSNLRAELLDALSNQDLPNTLDLMRKYRDLGEGVVEQQKGDDFIKAQIGIIVAQGLIYRDGGRQENFEAELYHAHQYAFNMRFDEVVYVLESAMSDEGRKEVQDRVPYDVTNDPKPLNEEYLASLHKIAAEFEAQSQPVHLEMDGNLLEVDGRLLEPSDGAPKLWRALTDGRAVIKEGLEKYRTDMKAEHPELTISQRTPITVMRLGLHPKDVLSAARMADKKEGFPERQFRNIDDIKEELRPFWQAVEASGYIPEVSLDGSRTGWYGLLLWAREPKEPDN